MAGNVYVTVYDVHPGLSGCPSPIPESLRIATHGLCGHRLDLAEVIDTLRDSVPDGALGIYDDFISYGCGRQVYVPCASPGLLVWQNNWRVVRIER